MKVIRGTIIFLRRQDKVLLAIKTDKIGKNKWNGYGGGLERGETPRMAIMRELFEESGLVVKDSDLTKIAIVDFLNKSTKKKEDHYLYEAHVYEAWRWEGILQKTREMRDPTWFPITSIPAKDMMPGDPFWIPRALSGSGRIVVKVVLGPNQEELLEDVLISEIEDFDEN